MEIQEAFGDQLSVQFIDLFYNKTEDLQGGILDLYDAMGSGIGVTQDMATAINSMEPAQYEVLQQKIQNVKESIGNSLLPTINDLLDKAATIIEKVGAWIENHQELVSILAKVVLTIGGVLTVVGTFLAVVGTVGTIVTKAISAFSMLKSGFVIVKAALSPLIGTVWSFTAALLANPITWIVIGIVALVAAIVLLWNKCEWFRNGITAIFNVIKNGAMAVFNFFKGIFEGIKNLIGNTLGKVKGVVSEKLSSIKSTYEEHGGGIKGVAAVAMEGIKSTFETGYNVLNKLTGGKLSAIRDKFAQGILNMKTAITDKFSQFKESGKKLIQTFTDGIKAAINAPVEAVKSGLQKIRNMLPFSDAKTGPLSTLTLSGQRTMTTYAHGLTLAENAPSEAVEHGLRRTEMTLKRDPLNSFVKRGKDRGKDDDEDSETSRKSIVIQKLLIHVTLDKLKDIPKLLAIVNEIEAGTISSGGDVEMTTASEPV